jgi:hypothetical protein
MSADHGPLSVPFNDKLPFEILVAIFDIYSEWDSIVDPLEKLLAICRSWSITAREHKTLWATFRIESTSIDLLRFWSSRVSRRIERSGDTTPLDLTIRGYAFMEGSDSEQEHVDLISKLTRDLIGENFSLVKRWKHVSIWYSLRCLQTVWNEALSQPTPNLRSLQLRYVNCQEPILPSAPLLEELTVYNCSIDLSSKLNRLRLLRLDSRAIEIKNLDMVSQFPNLTTLEMFYCYHFFRLPPRFPSLQNLILRGTLAIKILEHFSAPRLRCLSLSLDPEVDCGALVSYQGIDFTQLTTLHLECSIPDNTFPEHSVSWTVMGLKAVIEAATNVQHYQIYGIKALSILLLCFEQDLPSGTHGRDCTINARFYDKKRSKVVNSTFKFDPEATETNIRHIRSVANIPLEDTWSNFIERLARLE